MFLLPKAQCDHPFQNTQVAAAAAAAAAEIWSALEALPIAAKRAPKQSPSCPDHRSTNEEMASLAGFKDLQIKRDTIPLCLWLAW